MEMNMALLFSQLLLLVFTSTTTTTTTAFVPASLSPIKNKNNYYAKTKITTTKTRTILHAADLDVDITNIANSNDTSNNGGVTNNNDNNPVPLPTDMLELPRHSKQGVNGVLVETEELLRTMHKHSRHVDQKDVKRSMTPTSNSHYDKIFANTYVDLGKVDTVGFDYDYTLVHYTEELLELLYDMALTRLVNDRHYPPEMLQSGLKYDPFFSIRGAYQMKMMVIYATFSLFLPHPHRDCHYHHRAQVLLLIKRLVGLHIYHTHTKWLSHGRDVIKLKHREYIKNIEANVR
jgi:hypothetical protein